MNVSHPVVFSPRTSLNDAISATDAKGAILIGLASTATTAFVYSIVTRLLAHTPDQDISYDRWLRNMIFQSGFSKNLFIWLQGSDALRKSCYKDNRKPIHLSRLILPLTLKFIMIAFTASLVILSIPRNVEYHSDRGVGIAAYLRGNGTDLIPFDATLCKAFPKDFGRYTQLIDLQFCISSLLEIDGVDLGGNTTQFLIQKDPDTPWFIISSLREGKGFSSTVSMFLLPPTASFKEIELNIRDTTHENIALVVRNGLRIFECEMKDEFLGSFTESTLGALVTVWELESCIMDLNDILGVASKAILGSIYVMTNNSETVVHIHEDEIGPFNETLSRYDGPVIMGTEPVLGVATLLLLAGITFLLDLVLAFIKPGESDYNVFVATVVREVAGIDCLDNPLQAEKGKVIKFNRVMRGKEGHLGYVLKPNDIPVSEFPEGTTVRASAPSDLRETPSCSILSLDSSYS